MVSNCGFAVSLGSVWVKKIAGLVLVGLTKALNGFSFGSVDKKKRTSLVELWCGSTTIHTFIWVSPG
jgi:hypothetical protein